MGIECEKDLCMLLGYLNAMSWFVQDPDALGVIDEMIAIVCNRLEIRKEEEEGDE